MFKKFICALIFNLNICSLYAQFYTDYNFRLNKLTTTLGYFPELVGRGMVISIKDGNIDSSHPDLIFKNIYFDLQNYSEVLPHATSMALLVASKGQYSTFFKGIAPDADLHLNSSKSILPSIKNALTSGARLQLHPYGTGIENYYGLDAAAYDAMMVEDTSFLHIFSAGNSGTSNSIGGNYDGLKGWSNLTGNFKQSKNALVVGALDENENLLNISSRGPSFDGRVKPEIVAYGEKGTSDASAIVAGGILLLQELFKNLYGFFPASALLKSAIIASAKPVNKKLLSFKTGYGNFDHLDAMHLVEKHQFLQGEIHTNEVKDFFISIPDSIQDLRLSLNWIDPPSSVNASKTLMNDLDLKVIDKSGNVILPLVLNNSKDENTLNDDPINGLDHLNNVELIHIQNPLSGNLRLVVGSSALKTSSQKFYIAYSFKQSNTFEWLYAKDSIAYKENIVSLSWSTTYRGYGDFGYIDSSGNKKKIENVDVSSGYITFSFNYSGQAKFYIKIDGKEFISKEYFLIQLPVISQIIKTNGFMIFKHPNPLNAQIDAYTWNGTNKSINYKNLPQYNYYSWITFKPFSTYWFNYQFKKYGIESIPINVDTVSITSLIDDYTIQSSGGNLKLNIKVLMNDLMDSAFLLKKVFSKTIQVDSVAVKSGLLVFNDPNPLRGLNNYYLEIKTKIQSKPLLEDLKYFYVPGKSPVIYPNPVSKPACINIRFQESSPRTIQILSLEGKLLESYDIYLTETRICLPVTSDNTLILRIQSENESYSTILTLK